MLRRIDEILIVVLFFIDIGNGLHCYECSPDDEYGNNEACIEGKSWYLKRVQCRVPSVCAKYSFKSLNQGRPTVKRGCQGIQYGSTCEDIFNDLRSSGLFHRGHHECSTCSTDFCNSSGIIRSSYKILTSIIILSIFNHFCKILFL